MKDARTVLFPSSGLGTRRYAETGLYGAAGKKEKLETRVREALEQARAREYRTAIEQAKTSPMVMVGMALRGKETAVCWEEIE